LRPAPVRREQYPYVTATRIGEWQRDKLCRFALLMRGKEPIVGILAPPLSTLASIATGSSRRMSRPACFGMRGTVPPAAGLMQRPAEEIASLPRDAGVAKMPLGVDLAAMFFELQKAGMQVVDGQPIMLDAREIKNIDEIVLLNQAAAMVDATYHMIYEELESAVREADIVGKANELLYRLGSDDVEAIKRFPGNDAIRIRTISPIESSGRAIRPFLMSCSPIRATAPATTGLSMSGAPRLFSRTPTRSVANGSTWPLS
jgi:Xaa-Pro aminopeptidase